MRVCPGVSAFCGAAAALNLEYTLAGCVTECESLPGWRGGRRCRSGRRIASFAAHHATMVVFLSTGLLEELSKELIAGGYTADTPAAIVYKATWPEEEEIYLYRRNAGTDRKGTQYHKDSPDDHR